MGGGRREAGDWRLEIGDWRLERVIGCEIIFRKIQAIRSIRSQLGASSKKALFRCMFAYIKTSTRRVPIGGANTCSFRDDAKRGQCAVKWGDAAAIDVASRNPSQFPYVFIHQPSPSSVAYRKRRCPYETDVLKHDVGHVTTFPLSRRNPLQLRDSSREPLFSLMSAYVPTRNRDCPIGGAIPSTIWTSTRREVHVPRNAALAPQSTVRAITHCIPSMIPYINHRQRQSPIGDASSPLPSAFGGTMPLMCPP